MNTIINQKKKNIMKYSILLLILLIGCSPYFQNQLNQQNNSLNQLVYIHPEYMAIDSILQLKRLFLKDADSVFQKYKDRILSYISSNKEVFEQHDTIYFALIYQDNNRISCSYIWKIDSTKRDDIINEFNSNVFSDNNSIDSSFKYCLKISGNIIKSSEQIFFNEMEFNVGLIKSGGRSRAAIMRIIMQDVLGNMKYVYNSYLRKQSGLRGRITIEYTINQDGIVVYARVIKSTINQPELVKKVFDILCGTDFGKIEHGYDWTTVIYPFVYSY